MRIRNVFIAGDFNIANEIFSVINYSKYKRRDRNEFKYLDEILDTKHLSIINTHRIPTHNKGNVLDLIIGSAHLINNLEYHIFKCVDTTQYNKPISDHYGILSLIHFGSNNYSCHYTDNNKYKINNVQYDFANAKNIRLFQKNTQIALQSLYHKLDEIKNNKDIDHIALKLRHILHDHATYYYQSSISNTRFCFLLQYT
eukprot:248005_1